MRSDKDITKIKWWPFWDTVQNGTYCTNQNQLQTSRLPSPKNKK